MSRLAIVTHADRDWALAQKPEWARMNYDDQDGGEIVDRGEWFDSEAKQAKSEPSWFDFVIREVERFEKFFGDEQKTNAEWSALWRNSWWPKRREDWVYMAKKNKDLHPYFKRGTPEFDRALKVGTAGERMVWTRYGVAQFKPDDKRLKKVIGKSSGLSDRSKAMAGEQA